MTFSTKAIGGDTETIPFGRAYMAPATVCVQHGRYNAAGEVEHAVEVTKDAKDALVWMFSEHDQVWFHNGVGYDACSIIATYPDIAHLIWDAFERGVFLDTMFLQRMIQIATGMSGGPLALDKVCQSWGIDPPNKYLWTPHPDDQRFGQGLVFPEPGPGLVDVRTSFDLWYMADEIPEPWFGYADYDGIVQPRLAKRQCEKFCTPPGPGRVPMVRLEDLAQVCRTYFGLNLARVYGLRVDPTNVTALANAAHAAITRLKSGAIDSGFLKPVPAKRAEIAAGRVATKRFCNKHDSKSERTRAKHKDCPGCMVQGLDEQGDPNWKLDTKMLCQAIAVAYDGKPPLTEKKKDKKTGKMTGGGKIARSRDVLQDSGDPGLENFSEWNEWSVVVHKDLVMFEQSPIHAGIGVTNNLRPSSFDPNILNLRRDGFIVVSCPHCEYETTWDKEQLAEWKKAKCPEQTCPSCGK